MPLVSILDELRKAQEGLYAIPCSDTFEMMGTQGIFAALERKRAPGIVGIYSGVLDRPSGRAFAAFVRTMAEGTTVPVSLILDHGASYEYCIKALAYGFSDVMYDGSKLPLEENIANTRMIVRAAHAVGAAVEAELGQVGRGHEYRTFGGQGKGFTDPDAVERFVAETGVDFLAMAKVNVFTNLARAAATGMAEAAQAQDPSFLRIIGAAQEAFQEGCEHCLDVFGASGRA